MFIGMLRMWHTNTRVLFGGAIVCDLMGAFGVYLPGLFVLLSYLLFGIAVGVECRTSRSWVVGAGLFLALSATSIALVNAIGQVGPH